MPTQPNASALQAGRDYPPSYAELRSWFPDDAACLDYLEWLRWQNGFECPRCKVPGGWRLGDGRFWCEQCRRRASVTAGTIFHRTRTPLTVWFAAAWHVTSTKNGVSAKTLQRLLGFGSYQTAWTMLHRFRAAMVRPGRDRLAGTVEVDESYVGGPEKGVRGRQTNTKSIVVIAVELIEPKGFGRVRLRKVPDVSGDSLVAFVRDVTTLKEPRGWGRGRGLVRTSKPAAWRLGTAPRYAPLMRHGARPRCSRGSAGRRRGGRRVAPWLCRRPAF